MIVGFVAKISFHHEGTKDTKVSERKILNFVLFVTFVVNNFVRE